MSNSALNVAVSAFTTVYALSAVNEIAACVLGRYESRINSFDPKVECTEADRLFINDFTTYMREADVRFAADLYLIMQKLFDDKIERNADFNRAVMIFLSLRDMRKLNVADAYRDRAFMVQISDRVATLRLAAASIQIDEALDKCDFELALRGVVDMCFNIPFEALPGDTKEFIKSTVRDTVSAGKQLVSEVSDFFNRTFA